MEQETKTIEKDRIAAWVVSALGILVIGGGFVLWLIEKRPPAYGIAAAALSLLLFIVGCLRFVPRWMAFWSRRSDAPEIEREPKHVLLRVALLAVGAELVLFAAVTVVLRVQYGAGFTWRGAVEFWRCLDSAHYLDITREWYISDGDWGRVVQLVFLPGYPLTVYPLYRILGSDIGAGLLVSAAAFPAACCVLYRLVRLDAGHRTAFRTVEMLLLLPGGFFFIAPMSESLYLLLALSTLYLARKKRILFAGLCGAYCAFTRTLGLLLIAPLVLEWIHALPTDPRDRREWAKGIVAVLLVPLGFVAYLWINRTVSGNALQFLTYQRDHWSQRLGWFFNTASYQTEYLVESIRSGSRENILGLWLPNVVWHFGALGLFAVGAKRLRPSYAAWFIAYFLIAIGATWLLSGPRYLLTMPAVAMLLANCTEKRWTRWAFGALLVPLSALYLIVFVLRWQVW